MKVVSYILMFAGVAWANALAWVYPDSTMARRALDHPWQIAGALGLIVLGGLVGYLAMKRRRRLREVDG